MHQIIRGLQKLINQIVNWIM